MRLGWYVRFMEALRKELPILTATLRKCQPEGTRLYYAGPDKAGSVVDWARW